MNILVDLWANLTRPSEKELTPSALNSVVAVPPYRYHDKKRMGQDIAIIFMGILNSNRYTKLEDSQFLKL